MPRVLQAKPFSWTGKGKEWLCHVAPWLTLLPLLRRPYMNMAPLTVRMEMSAARVHRTFVTLGMRHLCVVNSRNHVCGVITRKDLHHAVTPMAHCRQQSATQSMIAQSTRAGLARCDSWPTVMVRGLRSLSWGRSVGAAAAVAREAEGAAIGEGAFAVHGLPDLEQAAAQGVGNVQDVAGSVQDGSAPSE